MPNIKTPEMYFDTAGNMVPVVARTTEGQPIIFTAGQMAPVGHVSGAAQRVITLKPINHVKECSLTLVTGGLWGFVWAAKVINRRFQR